jgi:hypothetical protein
LNSLAPFPKFGVDLDSSEAEGLVLTSGEDPKTNRALNTLHKGAEASDRFAHDEGVHLTSTLVRVQRLRVGKEAGYLVIEQNAIATEKPLLMNPTSLDRHSEFVTLHAPTVMNCTGTTIIVHRILKPAWLEMPSKTQLFA